MQDLAECDIIVEAVIENVDEKKKMYAALDGVVKKDCDLRIQHVIHFDYRAADLDQTSRSASSACTSSIPCR